VGEKHVVIIDSNCKLQKEDTLDAKIMDESVLEIMCFRHTTSLYKLPNLTSLYEDLIRSYPGKSTIVSEFESLRNTT